VFVPKKIFSKFLPKGFLAKTFLKISNKLFQRRQISSLQQGCQIFLVTTYQNWKNITNGLKIYQIAVHFIKWT
jgi:hypothetical protein